MTAIETNGLTKQFGESVLAVDELDLTVERGEVFGFLGPNGAGKSTTINMLLDLTRPTAGSASVLGLDVQAESQAIRERIGVLPEGYDLYDRLTGRSHIEFAMRAKGVDADPAAILSRVGLDEEDWDRDIGGYSKGMQQRLALGMALTGDPEVLILDEPSSGLDPTGITEVKELVREEADRGTAVFFSSHILAEVKAVCDRIGVLNDGRLVEVGTIEELQSAVGGDAELTLTVDRIPAGIDDLETLDGITGVRTTRETNTVTVLCEAGQAKAAAIEHLLSKEVEIHDIQVEDYSLEDIFATLTANGGETSEVSGERDEPIAEVNA